MNRSIAAPATAKRAFLLNASSAGTGYVEVTPRDGYRGVKLLIENLVSSSAMRSSWSMNRSAG